MAQINLEFQIIQDEEDFKQFEQFEELINQFENMQIMLVETEISDDEKYVYCDDDEIRFLCRDE